jgi:RNA polymerase sigma-70 factor, ECF subfamily
LLDDTTIREFLRDDYTRLVNVVALVSGSPTAVAEDAVQEALVKAWTRSERGEEIESLVAWVTTAALNSTRSGWRRFFAERRARERLEAQGVEVGGAGSRPDDRVDVARALAKLPRRQREVAVLRYLMDMSTAEVAQTLGVSEGTVKNSLWKARESMAASLMVTDMENDDANA